MKTSEKITCELSTRNVKNAAVTILIDDFEKQIFASTWSYIGKIYIKI